ncbi:FAD binding domain-containing protein [Rhodoplanes sp. Z2-YC6860]|uniref:FAD binding domain-containing protein n=1 Tax=Rhodoplanes sp. Z2-YC6860 TaxID=674703 RepID=UPI00078B2FC4|nr:xanthine dehydrogenase family protein subunit M [Rhodoplanes sp. Z2-YC6860]AMN39109.1 aerobic-type carbon monoxide dehydrogenase, middle subunit CoxM/CutM-like protein [Rhodoplanes sp. Z2-YC6860]
MRPFQFIRADSPQAAIVGFSNAGESDGSDERSRGSQYLAGGTTLLDLMKLGVMQPSAVVDINGLPTDSLAQIDLGPRGLRLGAMARMSDAAEHPDVIEHYPVIAQSLSLAASTQIRNMASLGGNVLQRTRCTYFRDTSYPNCNKRTPGSGCAAMDGINRQHAVLGVSGDCIASYPGDFAQALIALDAQVEINGPGGGRVIPFATLHRTPGDTPHLEHTLAPGDLIIAFDIPELPFARRSLFLKIRDRESYEFALASAAVALDLDGETVKDVRIALGGVATAPWRAEEAEARLKGQSLGDDTLAAAAEAAFAQASPREHNAFKIDLGKRTLVRALQQAATLEI